MDKKVAVPKFEKVHVHLSTGTDGNAFAIIVKVSAAMRKAGIDRDDIKQFHDSCWQCQSHDELLQLVMATVNVS